MRRVAPVAVCVPTVEEIVAIGTPSRTGRRANDGELDLALDLSTRCIGFAAGSKPCLHSHGKIIFRSTATIAEKLVAAERILGELVDQLPIRRLLVEKPMSRRGDVTGRHYELLGVVRKVWGLRHDGEDLRDSWIVSPRAVKSSFGVLRRGRNHDENKQIMVQEINKLYGLSLHFDKHSKVRSDDDTADAIAVLTSVWRRGERAA